MIGRSILAVALSIRSNRYCCYGFKQLHPPGFYINGRSSTCAIGRASRLAVSLASSTQSAATSLGRLSNRAWRRLGPVVDLILSASTTTDSSIVNSVADIGTDHGHVAAAVAVKRRHLSVLGIDCSESALDQGARKLYGKHFDNLDYRVGDGILCLQPGEADVVCVAGMGVPSIVSILSQQQQQQQRPHSCISNRKNENGKNLQQLDYLQTQHVVTQPTNTKPQNMGRLYHSLYSLGWQVVQERLIYFSSRWYWTTRLDRQVINSTTIATDLSGFFGLDPSLWPGRHLDADSSAAWADYVKHHVQWLNKDLKLAGRLSQEEETWLDYYDK